MSEPGGVAPRDSRALRARTFAEDMARHLDITAAILISIATIVTAWCVYQASDWGGDQSRAYAEASSERIESTREFNRAMQLLVIDADLFMQWVAAYNAGDQQLLSFYETNLMRAPFLRALNDWRATNPLENPNAKPNPLLDLEYQREMFAESDRLRGEAEALFEEATEANHTSGGYILATVSFASVLFFGGISPKFYSIRIQMALVGMGILMFFIGIFQIWGLPVH